VGFVLVHPKFLMGFVLVHPKFLVGFVLVHPKFLVGFVFSSNKKPHKELRVNSSNTNLTKNLG
jgi:hypothetical protein